MLCSDVTDDDRWKSSQIRCNSQCNTSDINSENCSHVRANSNKADIDVWHRIMGHCNYKDLSKL